jgi:hypothetical protein
MTKKHAFAIALIFVGTVIILFSAIGAVRAFRHMEDRGPFDWKPPAANQTDVSAIRDWMTIPYIAHMYDVPSDAIFKSLDIKKDDRTRKMSLEQLNDRYYPDQPGIVLAQTQALMQAFQQQSPAPPFPSTPVFTPEVPPIP